MRRLFLLLGLLLGLPATASAATVTLEQSSGAAGSSVIGSETDAARIPDVAHTVCVQLDAFSKTPLPAPVREYVDYVRVYSRG